MQSYKELLAWQQSMQLVSSIYRATKLFPREEVYGLTSQLRRSAVSVPSNIAEGQGRSTRGEFLQFLGHPRGSLFEVETQLTLAGDLGYLKSSDTSQLLKQITRVAQLLNGLISSLRASSSKRSTIHDSRSTIV
ncbi:MAG: four helix bundle protein [Candidatus Korobacteraceae bacterium]